MLVSHSYIFLAGLHIIALILNQSISSLFFCRMVKKTLKRDDKDSKNAMRKKVGGIGCLRIRLREVFGVKQPPLNQKR